MTSFTLPPLTIAPAQVVRGQGVLARMGNSIARLGSRPLIVAGDRTLALVDSFRSQSLADLTIATATYKPDCSEAALAELHQVAHRHQADVIIGVGGGKALDTAKLLAEQTRLPVVTAPTSAATCAAWTALSNVYSDEGAFLYDVGLTHCPNLLILDYDLIATAPQRTLTAGIGDALAKWYEASVSSGASDQTLIIAAVQQARVLRDILFQKAKTALAEPGGAEWREVVDASVLLAGVIGGLGGGSMSNSRRPCSAQWADPPVSQPWGVTRREGRLWRPSPTAVGRNWAWKPVGRHCSSATEPVLWPDRLA